MIMKKESNNFHVLFDLCKKIYLYIYNKIFNRIYIFQWSLSYSLTNNKDLFSRDLYKYKNIIPPKDRFWADPFVIKRNSKYFIYFEELLFKKNKGRISYIELDKHGQISDSRVILEKDYHLSYPFIFEDNNELYMIPETMENNTIELYKCMNFPNKWELDHIMMEDVQAVDSTIFKYNKKYWMFTNMRLNTNDSINEK